MGPEPAREEWTARDRAGLLRLRALGWTPGVVFDVGASKGYWSDAIAVVCPEAQYHLFEPLAEHVPEYRDSLSTVLREHPGFVVHPVALGDRSGEVLAYRFPNPYSSTTLPMDDPEPGVQPVSVPVTTIDDLIRSRGLPVPNFLKIDVQGSELAILGGAEQVLSSIDLLLVETWLWRTYEGKAPLLLEIAGWLATRGFYLWDFADSYRDSDDVLNCIDCFFINAQSMTPYVTYRTYRAEAGVPDASERARLLSEIARLRADLQRATREVALLQGPRS